MGKNKLRKFQQINTYNHVIQTEFKDVFKQKHELYGNWNSAFFKNPNPITLELACGKGEYSCYLAAQFPDKNYIGIDIKGARIWKGASIAIENNLKNIGFLRTRIEFIQSFFGEGEISELWITFPDPQATKPGKRLICSRFLNLYKPLLTKEHQIHLKTDSKILFDYAQAIIEKNHLPLIQIEADVYKNHQEGVLTVKTHYENLFSNKGKTIKYVCFSLNNDGDIVEPDLLF